MPNASIVFVDTNILVYAVSQRPADSAKNRRAVELIKTERIGLSFQALQEFYAVAVHPRKLGLTHTQAIAWCENWLKNPISPLTEDTFIRTVELIRRYQISNWDAAILAAAKQLGCTTVYSEDLNHGQEYDGVQVINPFLGL